MVLPGSVWEAGLKCSPIYIYVYPPPQTPHSPNPITPTAQTQQNFPSYLILQWSIVKVFGGGWWVDQSYVGVKPN